MIYNTTEATLWLSRDVCVPALGGAEVPDYLLKMKAAQHLLATGALSAEPAKPKQAQEPVQAPKPSKKKKAANG